MAGNEQAAWRFRGTFRSYQQRVLDQAVELMDDSKLHVVAAPGSGKTILGLELAGRFGRPVLAFSPTLAIRDQWITRLDENFDQTRPTDVSTDLRSPAFVTTSTYQALFHAVTGEHENGDPREIEREAVGALARSLSHVGTIILDEAHHLRTQWHRVLTALIDELRHVNPHLHIIALTATPPYDTGLHEWNKYIDLCGEIDIEISVPELVATGDLAPHQDFVYVGTPTDEERAQIDRLRAKLTQALVAIPHQPTRSSEGNDDQPALAKLASSPIMVRPEDILDECFDDEEGLAGFLLVLDAWGLPRPAPINALFEPGGHVGNLARGMRFIITHEALFDPAFITVTRQALADAGLIHRGKLVDLSDEATEKILATSLGKLAATAHVVHAEARAQAGSSRILVLSDHIRAGLLNLVGTTEAMPQIGVVPVFETLRRKLDREHRIAVLTGSLILAPTAITHELSELLDNEEGMTASPLPTCPEYSRLTFTGGTSAAIRTLTEAFTRGTITTMVGTAALLGEGWDMPGLTTLVLDSTIKATMMANQMRGRVIRIDPANPDKVANIWHVTCADHSADQPFADSMGVRRLEARMRNFVGPRATEPSIHSGLERCASTPSAWDRSAPDQLNADNLERAADRGLTRRLWDEALKRGLVGSAEGLNLHTENELRMPRPVKVLSGFDYFLALALGALIILFAQVLDLGIAHPILLGLLTILGIGLAGLIFIHVRTRRTLLNAHWRVTAQARGLLLALRNLGHITSPTADVTVAETPTPGIISVGLAGAKPREQEIFSTAIGQMCGPVTNPRYLLTPVRGPKIGQLLLIMSVPHIIGTNQDQVRTLATALSQHGMHTRPHYTRNAEGRALLIRARTGAASNIAAGFSSATKALITSHPRST